MREFSGKNGTLQRLNVSSKLIYTGFLLFAVTGLLSAALLHGDGLGVDAETAATYWRGDESQMVYPKSYRQILELTHFHLFTEPVTFLVIAHLYSLGDVRPALRVALPVAVMGAIALQIGLPWLTTYVAAGFSVLFIPVHAVLLLGLLYMAGASIWEMWRPT